VSYEDGRSNQRLMSKNTPTGWTFWLWWIVTSTVSWAVAFPVVDTITSPVLQGVDASMILPVSETVSEIADMAALFGVMEGVPEVIRGAVMTWLMQHSVPDPHRHLA
jgi:hypothetical protein